MRKLLLLVVTCVVLFNNVLAAGPVCSPKCAGKKECRFVDDEPTCVAGGAPKCTLSRCSKSQECFYSRAPCPQNQPRCTPKLRCRQELTCASVRCVSGTHCVAHKFGPVRCENDIVGINVLPQGLYKIAGTDVYVVGNYARVLLLLPDINGMSSEVMALARNFSKEGEFTAVVVDYFNEDPRNASDLSWSSRHNMSESLDLTNGVLADILKRGYSNIQAQGYCWGGKIGTSLAGYATIRSVAVAHPSGLVPADANNVNKPMLFEMPSTDRFNDIASQFNQTLSQRGIEAVFKIYPNTTHGFTVSDTINPVQKWIAFADSLSWFLSHK